MEVEVDKLYRPMDKVCLPNNWRILLSAGSSREEGTSQREGGGGAGVEIATSPLARDYQIYSGGTYFSSLIAQ